ncbi:MAG: LysR family transcriptional regulator [Clostridia bacterium]|jgi:molybdate transport system regulatory protein|nr:LysR family transcriptional regulator [Clostridia bacterium]MBT7123111.1 LysR family transcriptional regulator [Clostridia bacterium]
MNELRYSAKLVLHRDVKFFGPGVVELLQRVHLCHSLHKASKEMSMAYTKALKLVKTAETNLGFKLLNQKIGGISGGGSKLTPEAKKIIALYEAFDEEISTVADREFETFKTEIEKMRQD